MEKSIESIWREGFLENEALIAPKINDLYNQKSQHVVERFKRMFRINLKLIAIGSVPGLIGFLILQIPITGIVMFLTLWVVFIVNHRLLKQLEKVDKSQSSYDYLKSFDHWVKHQLSINADMARVYYPVLFLGVVVGNWFSDQGQRVLEAWTSRSDVTFLVNGMPVVLVIPILIIAGLLCIFGKRLFYLELMAVYGRVFTKLDEILADMEELRS